LQQQRQNPERIDNQQRQPHPWPQPRDERHADDDASHSEELRGAEDQHARRWAQLRHAHDAAKPLKKGRPGDRQGANVGATYPILVGMGDKRPSPRGHFHQPAADARDDHQSNAQRRQWNPRGRAL
jgi:hypothetical protein